jgi:hypothetical protein
VIRKEKEWMKVQVLMRERCGLNDCVILDAEKKT